MRADAGLSRKNAEARVMELYPEFAGAFTVRD
jgi:hypothetical protein